MIIIFHLSFLVVFNRRVSLKYLVCQLKKLKWYFPFKYQQAVCCRCNVTVLTLKHGVTLNLLNYYNIEYNIKIIMTTNNASRYCQNVPWGAKSLRVESHLAFDLLSPVTWVSLPLFPYVKDSTRISHFIKDCIRNNLNSKRRIIIVDWNTPNLRKFRCSK